MGYVSVNMQIKLPGENRNQAFSLISFSLTQKKCKIRQFARFIGTLVSIYPAVKYGRLYLKSFVRQKVLALQANAAMETTRPETAVPF